MDSRKLHQALRQRPFRPFEICLADGRRLPIPHPDFVAVGKRRVIVVEPDDSWSVIEPPLIVSLDYSGERPGEEEPSQEEDRIGKLHDNRSVRVDRLNQRGDTMDVFLGFDPGGTDGFGWCAADAGANLPLRIRGMGVVDDAQCAIGRAMAHVAESEQVTAAGIDAPLFWVKSGGRKADTIIRRQIRQLGAKSPGGTVQAVNSLRGACLVQGMLTAVLLRKSLPDLLITESHPKAILWLLRIANKGCHPNAISLSLMRDYFESPFDHATDHKRDAAIAALSAWAMANERKDWQDLYAEDHLAYSPIGMPLGYWIPRIAGEQIR